jgi:hypothetical protein
MGNYKKQVRGENISADEIAAHNHIQIFNDGSGKIIVCFCLVLITGCLVYLWIAVHLLIVAIIIGSSILAIVVGVSATWRHVSNTRKQHLVNEAEIEWSKIIYQTENLVATLNRSTREITVHNAQQIQEVHHHAPVQISEFAQSHTSLMPKLSDLSRDKQA